ncbi:MAG: radical SAM protein [Acidobacteria bacterium]|nr:radical SAM protein [Acidobacteriota bacterium]
MQENKVYILNPDYSLKYDKKRVIITNKYNDPTYSNFIGFVHPVYAILFSLFDGRKKLGEVIESVSILLKKESSEVSNIVTPLLENEDPLFFNFDNTPFSFPKKLLVKTNGKLPENFEKHNPQEFFIPKDELDLRSWRLYYPLDALFMVNTRCVTDCIYCYADRRNKMDCKIPIKRLKEIIKEAKRLKMRSFDLTGGETFLHEHWEEFLKELAVNDFKPYLSTKYPIGPDIIKKYKDLGLKKIQISIDSIYKEKIMQILNVKEDYYHRLLETFKNLDENDFDIYTNTQLTSVNSDPAHIEALINYLLGLKNIKRINFGAAGYSLYKSEDNYLKYKAPLETVKQVESLVNDLKTKHEGNVNINFSGYSDRNRIINKDVKEKEKNFKERSRCSANFYAFVILPDGKVTICEELYWHPVFIIGDLNKQSIEEIWNSKRALELYNISQDLIRSESMCKKCEEFESCHKYKGVCWKEILYAYGYENWDYADPKCFKATKPQREYYL